MVSKDSNTPVLTSSSSYVTIDGQPVLRSYIATLISNDLANGGGPTTVRRLAARRLAQATGTPAPGTPAPGNPAPGSQGGSTSVTPGSTPHLFNATPPPGTSPTNAYYYTGNPADAPMEQPSTDPTQSYDSYNNYTSNDMTPAMMQHAVNYGPAPECSMAMRVFTPMDSLMDPKSLDYLRRVVIHQARARTRTTALLAGRRRHQAATSASGLRPCHPLTPAGPAVVQLRRGCCWVHAPLRPQRHERPDAAPVRQPGRHHHGHARHDRARRHRAHPPRPH